ncbi:MAG: TIGR02757 family protein [Thermodesulfobacteriota bacterium]
MDKRNKKLKTQLTRLYRTFDLEFLSPDPLELVRKFRSARNKEVAGLVASSLAYGRVEGILRSVTDVMERIKWQPYLFTMNTGPKEAARVFKGFKHRFNTGADVACLLYFARQMIEAEGSIGAFFTKGYNPKDKNIKNTLISFTERTLALDSGGIYGVKSLPKNAGVRYFFPSPLKGSACKRLNLYLRWMVRKGDSLDFGLWTEINPAKLIIPLDTHVARISRNIGLTKRKSANWRMAEEITEALAALDKADPVKFDFSLCRLGILEKCPKNTDPALCEKCLIREICVL